VLQKYTEREREFEMNNWPCKQAARKMVVGPPGSAFRSWSQTSPSGGAQKALS
jgi:hypothetical protein